MAHCLYEKARLYDLCEAGLNFLKCHGSIYAEVFITRNRADRQVMLRGKRTGKNVSASGSESGSRHNVPPVVLFGIRPAPSDIRGNRIGRNSPFPAITPLDECSSRK